MEKRACTIFIALLLVGMICVRANGSRSQSFDEQEGTQNAAAQSPELEEAKRLSTEVVKLYGEGKYDEALRLAKRALEIREKLLGKEHPLVADALVNLAEIYLAKKDYNNASSPLERALKINAKVEGADTLSNTIILDKLAFINFSQGFYSKTESLYQNALSIREKVLGPESLEVATSLFKLAEFYRLRGKYDKAVSLYQRVLAIKEKALGNENKEIGEVLEPYSCVLRRTGQSEEGEKMENRSFAILFKDVQKAVEDQHGTVFNGKAVSLPKPYYPPEAKAERLSGTVKVRVIVDEAGKVIRACAISGPFLLIRPSEWAAYQSRFAPTMVAGKPVKVTGIITYNYVAR